MSQPFVFNGEEWEYGDVKIIVRRQPGKPVEVFKDIAELTLTQEPTSGIWFCGITMDLRAARMFESNLVGGRTEDVHRITVPYILCITLAPSATEPVGVLFASVRGKELKVFDKQKEGKLYRMYKGAVMLNKNYKPHLRELGLV